MRKVIQISAYQSSSFIAVCDDGSLWKVYYNYAFDKYDWEQIPDVPSPGIKPPEPTPDPEPTIGRTILKGSN